MKPAVRLSLALCAALWTGPVAAVEVPVNSGQIATFKGATIGERVEGVVWRGGIVMSSADTSFGGLSGVTFTGPDHRIAMVTDVGSFVSGLLLYDENGAPLGLGGVEITPIENSGGQELPRQFARDAEAIDTIYRDGAARAVRVGFENLTRVADFELTDHRPGGAAREVTIPEWVEQLRTNTSLESVCIAPPASPVAGSTLLITEGAQVGTGFAAYMMGLRDRGPFTVSRSPGVNPSDCAFLPNGDLLVLERGTSLLSFTMQVRRIPAADVRPGTELTGEVILTASGGDIDNMEGLAVHDGPNGETRITIVSDDNFNDWERSLLLEFSLPEE